MTKSESIMTKTELSDLLSEWLKAKADLFKLKNPGKYNVGDILSFGVITNKQVEIKKGTITDDSFFHEYTISKDDQTIKLSEKEIKEIENT